MTAQEPRGVVALKAEKLILKFEGFDLGGYPGGASGCTLAFGYDLGYHTLEQFMHDWEHLLSRFDFERLAACIGKKGEAAKEAARQFTDKSYKYYQPLTSLTREDGMIVFRTVDLPRWEAEARAAFPGFESLPEDAEGGVVALTFNRGPGMGDPKSVTDMDRRREMREVRELIAAHEKAASAEQWIIADTLRVRIANAIRKMKRLWIGKGLDGLIKRREAEAVLVESTVGIRGTV